MDKLLTYRKYIQQLIEQYATYGTPTDDVEREMVMDTTHDHY